MTLSLILISSGISLAIGLAARGRWRGWALLIASILVIYWLQPSTPIRNLDFWLPTASIGLSFLIWAITAEKNTLSNRENLASGIVIVIIISAIGATRYMGALCCFTPSRPPALYQILLAISVILIIGMLLFHFANGRIAWLIGFSALILLVLIILKYDPLTKLASMNLRIIAGQSPELATGLDVRWLGFSYVAFRLLHSLIDRINNRLPSLNLQEFIIFIIFYPAFSAGPIDRVQRFIRDIRQPYTPTLDETLAAGHRILVGVFRKFVLADGLALFALSSMNATQVKSPSWLWIMLYAYALRIYFDFSGYIDIAIGAGKLVGIQLPENFDKPYTKQNLTLFWNSWHMTLAGWFRAYFFNPVTRKLRTQSHPIPLPFIILFGQLSTFILIGLWHGITWNFAIWGAWHGVGLFIHNRWSESIRSRQLNFNGKPWMMPLIRSGGIFLTFQYVSLGWIWFALSSPSESLLVLQKLFGIG